MKLIDQIKNLILKVYGKIPKDQTDSSKLIEYINHKFGNKNYERYFDLLNAVLSKSQKARSELNIEELKNDGIGNINDAIKNLLDESVTEPLILDLFQRRIRYNNYRSIVKKISRLKRAIKIFTSNIISGDNLMTSNEFMIVTNSLIELDEKNKDTIKKQIHLIIDSFDLLSKRKSIIYNTLMYGDYFVEIVDYSKVIDNILMESQSFYQPVKLEEKSEKIKYKNIELKVNFKTYKNIKKILLESDAIKNNVESFFDTLEELFDNAQNNKQEINKQYSNIQDIGILLHHPENVIKVNIGDSRIGYIIVPKLFYNIAHNTFQYGFKTETWPGMNPAHEYGLKQSQFTLYENAISLAQRVFDFLDKQIIRGIVDENPELKETIVKFIYNGLKNNVDLMNSSNPDARDIVEKITINDLNLRFVPEQLMQEFSIDIDEYAPYGTSLLDEVVFDSKLLLTNKLSATILRLTRSVERRIIEYEIRDNDSVAAAEVLKEKFKKSRMMFNDNASIDTIPTLISPFQDYFLPLRNGQRFVNIGYEDPSGTIPTMNDDIKFLRDEIVSYFDIPPAYLGLEENIESKATLFLQNVIFAITIMDYKEVFSNYFTELINKILKLTGKENYINKFRLLFNIPVILSSSSELEHIGQVSNIWDFLSEQLKLSKDKIIERYMPYFSEYLNENIKVDDKIKKLKSGEISSSNESENEEEGGGGGFSAPASEEELFKI